MPDRRRYGRSPETIAILAGAALSGALQTSLGRVPASIADLVPQAVGIAWGVTFTLAAVACLTGLYWPAHDARSEETGYIVELSGRFALSLTSLGYVLALLAYGTLTTGGLTLALVTAILVSSVVRIFQLTLKLRRWQENLDVIRGARP